MIDEEQGVGELLQEAGRGSVLPIEGWRAAGPS